MGGFIVSMAITFFIISLIFLGYLSIYAFLYLFFSFAPLFIKNNKDFINNVPDIGDVSVLVPSHYEGNGLIDAVQTIIKQDYQGLIKIYILVKDDNDNSVNPLKDFFQFTSEFKKESENFWQRTAGEAREVNLIFTGLTAKKDKLNYWLKNISTKYVAFLDADHRASSNWISSSLVKMIEKKSDAAQTRRRPLLLGGFSQLWDSVQNHIGNELVNFVLAKFKKSVFFTGTTCLFKAEIFKNYIFSDSVTEDTYLSYDLLCNGKKISYNDASSSFEEVSPNLKNYIFRKRRWSAGHSKTFFDHLKKIFKSPLKVGDKLQLLFHGQFYLIPVVVLLLLNVYGIYFFFQFTRNIQLVVILASLFFSGILATIFYNQKKNIIADYLISFFWLFPQISILSIYIYKILGSEIYYYILSFPFAKNLVFLHLILIFSPLLVIISGIFFFKQYKNFKYLWLLPSYPFFMFFDIYGCLLGFGDFLFGNFNWAKIKRENIISYDLVPEDIRQSIITGKSVKTKYKKYIFLLAGIILIIISNDLLAIDNCGEIKPFLWKPIIIKPHSSVNLEILIDKGLNNKKILDISINTKIVSQQKINLKYFIEGLNVLTSDVSGNDTQTYKLNYPLGWEKKKIDIVIKGNNLSCKRTQYFSTTLREIKNNSLYVNEEKFIIKGIIPSFSNNQTNIPIEQGLKEIKETGANAIRFYHSINDKIASVASKYNLMIINQPDRSSWNEFDPESPSEVKSYLKRYEKMIKNNEGFPYLLFDGLGNEWELTKDQTSSIPEIKNLIKEVSSGNKSSPISYSTYLTYANYPVDVLGVNMLDSGKTYWEKAINLLKDFKTPFYASEFGGFVAFWESVVPELRITRLVDDWDILMKNGALGANFFESHDNWAQPVVIGYNDPFKPEQPDDLRGFWDRKNNEKLELKFLKDIFSDFNIQILEDTISSDAKEINIKLENKREYFLKDVNISYDNFKKNIGDFKPLETKEIKLELDKKEIQDAKLNIRFEYQTHSGFNNISVDEINLPVLGDSPKILNKDFLLKEVSGNKISGEMIFSNKIDLVLPNSWSAFNFNGEQIEKTAERMSIDVINPYYDVLNLEYSRDGRNWLDFDSKKIDGGIYYLRFKLPTIKNSKGYLILTGIGASNIILGPENGQSENIQTHNYRENVIDLNSLGADFLNNYLILKVDRQQIKYVSKERIASNQDVTVDMEPPRIFSPLDIEITKEN